MKTKQGHLIRHVLKRDPPIGRKDLGDPVDKSTMICLCSRRTRPLWATFERHAKKINPDISHKVDDVQLLDHLHPPWDDEIPWYPCCRLYTRREIAADAAVHAIGIMLGLAGWALLASRLTSLPPGLLALLVGVYATSLLAMFVCSAAFNVGQAAWAQHGERLALLDHIGICLLIAGSSTPVFATACAFRALGCLWLVMLLTIAAKWSRGRRYLLFTPFSMALLPVTTACYCTACCGRLDNIWIHVAAFVLGPLASVLAILDDLRASLSPHDINLIWASGIFYVGGLLPWSQHWLEFHVAIWHLCVVIASAAIFALVYGQVWSPCTPPPGQCVFPVPVLTTYLVSPARMRQVDTPQKVADFETHLSGCFAG